MKIPCIALTMGDPAGIGPELVAKAVAATRFRGRARFVVYDTVRAAGDFRIGVAAAACGKAAYDAVTAATLDALAGRCDAVVTAPMNKYSVNLAGIAFTGHTELIAALCQVADFAMMQSSGNLRVAFVTTHIALAEVPKQATFARIVKVAQLLEAAVRAEGVAAPRLAAAAINPHAGENGFMGGEDEAVVKPALARLREGGMTIDGPFPPDTLFIAATRRKYDGILSMYHDQGHIPFKMLAFDSGVNSTLGLPIIRTSPDHGTAFDIAGRNRADTGSFFAAIELAIARAGGRGRA